MSLVFLEKMQETEQGKEEKKKRRKTVDENQMER
jgi:hypothetical protein